MSAKKGIIVAVDDEQDNLDLVHRVLKDLYEVHLFIDPTASIEQIIRLQPIVILADYRMPQLNGVELIRELRAREVTSPVLMVTAFPELDDVVMAHQGKLLYNVLRKPYTADELRHCVEVAVMMSGGR